MTREEFAERFTADLTEAQRTAVETTEGPVLVLACPGAGKTAAIVTRIGYMVSCLGIEPSSILAISYTVASTRDMEARFLSRFGALLQDGGAETALKPASTLASNSTSIPAFRTINSICLEVINRYGRMIGKAPFALADDSFTGRALSDAFRTCCGDFPTESDIAELASAITYIKNAMLTPEELHAVGNAKTGLPGAGISQNSAVSGNLEALYKHYTGALRAAGRMDFDDQLVYAHRILTVSPQILSAMQDSFRYILLDEAQDASTLQFAVISLLAGPRDNFCAVGDEDQSIYGFRGGDPDNLLNFAKKHPGTRTIRFEHNFRSDPAIVNAAARFINGNYFRTEKTMLPVRPAAAHVRKQLLPLRAAQYRMLLALAEEITEETAILYRDNESMLPIVDLFERNQIPYRMKNSDLLFFSHRSVLDIGNLLRFALAPSDTELFLQLYYRINTFLSKEEACRLAELSARDRVPVLQAAEYASFLDGRKKKALAALWEQLEELPKHPASRAIGTIMYELGYASYLARAGMSDRKIFILRQLAVGEPDIKSFLSRLDTLRTLIRDHENPRDCLLTLSTIHSSKGLEYRHCILIDVIDGLFPEQVLSSKDRLAKPAEYRTYEEERRLFYVGITRAKDTLTLYTYDNAPSAFAKELFRKKKTETDASDQRSGSAGTRGAANIRAGTQALDDSTVRAIDRRLKPGVRVEHKVYGPGVVSSRRDDDVVIRFEDGSERTFRIEFAVRNRLLTLPE